MDKKATLRVDFPELSLSVPIRYGKISSKLIRDKLIIIKKERENGKEVQRKKRVYNEEGKDITEQTTSRLVYRDTEGNIYDKDEIQQYQINGEKETPIQAPSETTKVFEGFKEYPLKEFETFLQEKDYRFEIYPDVAKKTKSEERNLREYQRNENALFHLGEHMLKKDICLMCDYQKSRVFFPYKLVMRAHRKNGSKMGIEFILTMTRLTYQHLLEKATVKQKAKTPEVKEGAKLELNI